MSKYIYHARVFKIYSLYYLNYPTLLKIFSANDLNVSPRYVEAVRIRCSKNKIESVLCGSGLAVLRVLRSILKL